MNIRKFEYFLSSVSRAEITVLRLVIERVLDGEAKSGRHATVVSVEEYRKLTHDYESSDEAIEERLEYLEAFCRNITKHDIKKFYEQSKKNFLFTKNS